MGTILKRILIIIVCICMLGCAYQKRLTRLKDRNENVVLIQISGNIDKAKNYVREAANELGLFYLKETETHNFVVVRANMLTNGIKNGLFGGAGSDMTRLGFFFTFNSSTNTTDIKIAEEVNIFGRARRSEFIDKIKIKELERQALTEKVSNGN